MPRVSNDFRTWGLELDSVRKTKFLTQLSSQIVDGFVYHKIIYGKKGKPVNSAFLEVNDAFEGFTGLKRENILRKRVAEVFPNPKKESCKWIDIYEKVMLSEDPVKLTCYSQVLDKWFEVSLFYVEKDFCLIKFEDITKRKKNKRARMGNNNIPKPRRQRR